MHATTGCAVHNQFVFKITGRPKRSIRDMFQPVCFKVIIIKVIPFVTERFYRGYDCWIRNNPGDPISDRINMPRFGYELSISIRSSTTDVLKDGLKGEKSLGSQR